MDRTTATTGSEKRPIRVLYVHGCGAFSGAARSLITMIQAFPPGTVQPYVISPKGSAAEFFQEIPAPVITTAGLAQFDNGSAGYYRGRRWLILLRELYLVLPTILAFWRARRRWKVDLVHINDVTLLLPMLLASHMLRVPVVAHVRVVQSEKAPRRARLVAWFLRRYCHEVVAIDENVRASLPADLDVRIVHNGSAAPASVSTRPGARPMLPPRREGCLRVATVNNLLPIKGVYEFVNAARTCKERGLQVEFVLAGENTRALGGLRRTLLHALHFARDVRADLEAMIARYELEGWVYLIGFTTEVKQIYEQIDVLCFPSYLRGVGRPVFEAAFSKVPSIVALTDPRPDTFIHGETGLCIPPADAAALADAIEFFYRNPAEIRRMGQCAYELARVSFDSEKNSRKMLATYREILACKEPVPVETLTRAQTTTDSSHP